jgi:hypothetical protein
MTDKSLDMLADALLEAAYNEDIDKKEAMKYVAFKLMDFAKSMREDELKAIDDFEVYKSL